MKCPRTDEPVVKRQFGDLEVDVSTACGGIWFERFELPKVQYKDYELGAIIAEYLSQYSNPLLDTAPRLNCPRDTDVVMMRRYFSPKQQIEIDECPACGGIWLDAEELAGIRSLFRNATEREQASREFVDTVMSSPEVKAFEHNNQEFGSVLGGIGSALWRAIGGQ